MSKRITAALIRIGKNAQRDSSASVGAISVSFDAFLLYPPWLDLGARGRVWSNGSGVVASDIAQGVNFMRWNACPMGASSSNEGKSHARWR
jgi:hypothetical protein